MMPPCKLTRLEKALKFVEHIEKHLTDNPEPPGLLEPKNEVICTLCGKTIDQIWEEREE